MITLENIVIWCLANRKTTAFIGWSEFQIAQAVYEAYVDKTIMVITDSAGYLVGLVIWKELEDKTLYIYQIITTQAGILKQFIQTFKTKFPGYRLTAIRHASKVKAYKTDRLVNLIETICH